MAFVIPDYRSYGGRDSNGLGAEPKKKKKEFIMPDFQSYGAKTAGTTEGLSQDRLNYDRSRGIGVVGRVEDAKGIQEAPKLDPAKLPDKFKLKSEDGKQEVEFKRDEFVQAWDQLSEQKRKLLFKRIQDDRGKGNEGAMIADKALDQAGKYKGGFSDFLEGYDDKLRGGFARSAARLVDKVMPGDQSAGVKDFLKRGDAEDEIQYKGTGRLGEKVGSIQKGGTEAALIAMTSGGAGNIVRGASGVQKLAEGGKVASTVAKVAPKVAASLAGTVTGAISDVGMGNDSQVARNAAIGTAADVLLPGAGKLLKGLDSQAGKAVAKIAGDSDTVAMVGEKGLIGGANKVVSQGGKKAVYATSDLLQKTKVGNAIIDRKDKFMKSIVTDLHPVWKNLKRLDFEQGAGGKLYAEGRLAIGDARRTTGQAENFIAGNVNAQQLQQGLADYNLNAGKAMKDFDEYTKARSELERVAANRKDFSPEKIQNLQDRLGKAQDFSKEYDSLVNFYKDVNDFRVANGAMSKEAYDEFAKDPYDYIRRQQVQPDGAKAGFGSNKVASITKSELNKKMKREAAGELTSPIETAMEYAYKAHAEAATNKAAKSLVDLLGDEARILPGAKLTDEFGKPLRGSENTISFLDNGSRKVVQVDPAIAAAITGFDSSNQMVINNTLRKVQEIFKLGTTGVNPVFALVNPVRDIPTALVNSRAPVKTAFAMVNGIASSMGKPLTKADAELWSKYAIKNAGALSWNQYAKPREARRVAMQFGLGGKEAKALTEQLTKPGATAMDIAKTLQNQAKKTYTYINNPRDLSKALYETVSRPGAIAEDATRFALFKSTYQKAKKEGASDIAAEKAATLASRESTTDFLEIGTGGRVLNSLLPYFNAGIQGGRAIFRGAGERPVSFAAKVSTLVGVPTAVTTAHNLSDPKRKAAYDTIPEYVKENNFIIIPPSATYDEESRKWKGIIMIPKPPGLGAMADPIRKFMEFKAEIEPGAGSSFGDFLKQEGQGVVADIGQAFSPIDVTDKNKFLSSVTPQIVKPTAQTILNREFYTGQDIVPEWTQTVDGWVKTSSLPPEEQKKASYSQSTSGIAKKLGISPLLVDSWIKATFGEVGLQGVNLADRIQGAPEEAVGGRSISEGIARRFVEAPGGADTQEWYKAYTPAQDAKQRANTKVSSLIEQGKPAEARMIAEEFNNSLKDRFKPFFSKYRDNPNYDPEWDNKLDDLFISTTPAAFKRRQYAIKKRLEEESR